MQLKLADEKSFMVVGNAPKSHVECESVEAVISPLQT